MAKASDLSNSVLFRVVTYSSRDTPDLIVSRCPELNLVGTGNTWDEAVLELLGNIEAQITFCVEQNAELFHPNPVTKL